MFTSRSSLHTCLYSSNTHTHTHLVSTHNKRICGVTKLSPLTYRLGDLGTFFLGFWRSGNKGPSHGNACTIVEMHGCQHHVTNLHMWVLDAWWCIGFLDYMLTWDQIYSHWTSRGSCETCKLFALSMYAPQRMPMMTLPPPPQNTRYEHLC